MLTYSLASYTSLLPCQPVSSGIPTKAKFQVSLLSRVVGGGWSEIEIKAKLSPAEAGVWAELGNKVFGSLSLVVFFYWVVFTIKSDSDQKKLT